ncbi:DUF4269 domain-containing protein [Flavobacterium sp. ASW18X]|uniref:DUF4269 domain-containing protein n=1 Tax=Flavobacterium sp. ASW18X TaxID=2572595 RepID=UPI0010AE3DAA|nr:DUF4269 domain-containing protein [Flavobacterium sp. ASW18X]TKD66085.1 DUF4269 domain-containing protein [Flavobacterium sp. ASW18X]
MIDFSTITYLKQGDSLQRQAYLELTQLKLFEVLAPYKPVLAGTIPIGIAVSGSDLVVCCECYDAQALLKTMKERYGGSIGFTTKHYLQGGVPTTLIQFFGNHFLIEVFAQPVPSKLQNGYRHMIIEHQLLVTKGDDFRKKVIELKQKGVKTEPAFAQILGLEGNPYQALLHYPI